MGSGELEASNEEEVIGVSISFIILKISCTEISRRNLVSMSKN